MKYVINLLINAVIIILLSYLLPGVETTGFVAAIIVALVISILNFIVKPILIVLTLPVTVLTLGLFLFVVNAIIILLADWLIGGFSVDGFWYALLFSICLSIARAITSSILEKDS
ncbi:MAG: phage holin family protein [Nonlabens sp.]